MDYFPLFLRIQGQPCLIVGGGDVALRKIRLLRRANAAITVIALELHAELAALADNQQITHIATDFNVDTDVSDFRLIIAATDDKAVNSAIAARAEHASVPCNVVDDRQLSTAIMPGIVDRAPLIIAVSSGGDSPVMTTRLRQQIERLLPTELGRLGRFAGEWRHAVKQRFADVPTRRRFWQTVLEGPIATRVLNNELTAANSAMHTALEDGVAADGIAWIVGAGPGDPELLTLKAARVLGAADIILHDRLVAPAILDMARKDAEFVSVGKQAGTASISQDAINELLVASVRAGAKVCRLKGGDPFIFGRGGEEIEALDAAGLHWEVIPGITAAAGCAAATGIPLTHRNVARAVTFITASTATDEEHDWSEFAGTRQTLVIYMPVRRLAAICSGLMAAGKAADHPAVVIENGTTVGQRVIRGTLATISDTAAAEQVGSPAILLVGEVTELSRLGLQADNKIDTTGMWAPAASQG